MDRRRGWAAAKRPFAFLAINAGANLVSLLIMGAVLGRGFGVTGAS